MAEQILTCIHCGGMITPRINKTTGLPSKAVRKFCSPKCNASHHAPKPVHCEHCKKIVFRRVRGGKSDAGRFCSRDCAFAYKAEIKVRRAAEALAQYLAAAPLREMIRIEVAALRRIAAYVERPRTFRLACCKCGSIMIVRRSGGLHKKVCNDCLYVAIRRGRSIHKRKRRAIKRGSEADSIDPIKVFERDKWRCHLCGVKTLKSKRGTYDDRAPELEHIVSISSGGSHTWGNVACSCRKCNRAKGAVSFGQLGLPIPM